MIGRITKSGRLFGLNLLPREFEGDERITFSKECDSAVTIAILSKYFKSYLDPIVVVESENGYRFLDGGYHSRLQRRLGFHKQGRDVQNEPAFLNVKGIEDVGTIGFIVINFGVCKSVIRPLVCKLGMRRLRVEVVNTAATRHPA